VNGIPTTTLTCAGATDVAGNVAPPVSFTYVAPITFTGFFAPVDNLPTINQGTAGRTYPIAFRLTGIDGAPITVTAGITTTYRTGAACTGLGDLLETESAGSSTLVYDPVTNRFQYNWKTPKTKGCYDFLLGVQDGTTVTARFSLK
jgi:hypothetical protein